MGQQGLKKLGGQFQDTKVMKHPCVQYIHGVFATHL
jgi:hypothetical protein